MDALRNIMSKVITGYDPLSIHAPIQSTNKI